MLYNGDISVEHGGAWIDLSTWDDDYCTCVRVTDLDSACGATGMIMIEHVVILLNKKHWASAMQCCGQTVAGLLSMGSDARKHCLADCLLMYGHYDPDDSWDNYANPYIEIIQTEDNGPLEYDGWVAKKRIHCENLRGYIESVHIK